MACASVELPGQNDGHAPSAAGMTMHVEKVRFCAGTPGARAIPEISSWDDENLRGQAAGDEGVCKEHG
jgi:hypothetical protein